MEETYSRYYISVDASDCIIGGYSDLFRAPQDGDICINDKGHGHFRLFPNGEENPTLFDGMSMIPLYKWDGEQVVRRTEAEIEADREAAESAREAAEQERVANDPTTLTMEMAVDHELRIATLEMGINMGGEV